MNVSWALHVWVVAVWPGDPHIFNTPGGIKVVTLITSQSFISWQQQGITLLCFSQCLTFMLHIERGHIKSNRGEAEKRVVGKDYSVTSANKMLEKSINRDGRRKTRTPRRSVELRERKMRAEIEKEREISQQSQWSSNSEPWVGELQTTEPRRIVTFLINC